MIRLRLKGLIVEHCFKLLIYLATDDKPLKVILKLDLKPLFKYSITVL